MASAPHRPLEAGLYALGRRKLADLFPEEKDPVKRQALIHAEIYSTYRKDFWNLGLQERRLRSQLNSDLAELENCKKTAAKNKPPTSSAPKRSTIRPKTRHPLRTLLLWLRFFTCRTGRDINREQAPAFAQGQPSGFTKEQFVAYFAQWKERQAA